MISLHGFAGALNLRLRPAKHTRQQQLSIFSGRNRPHQTARNARQPGCLFTRSPFPTKERQLIVSASSEDSGTSSVAFDAILDSRNYEFGLDFDHTYITTRRKLFTEPLPLEQPDSPISVQAYLQYVNDVSKPDADVDVLHCALLISKMAYPNLQEQLYMDQLAALAQCVEDRLEGRQDPRDKIQMINRVLFAQPGGFEGDTWDFYSPNNSFINKVLDTQKGSPAALALVYMEVARRVGLELRPVFMPSHTFLRLEQSGVTYLLDPWNNGQVCNQKVVEARLSSNLGFSQPVVKLDAKAVEEPPVFPRKELLIRLLCNLREAFWGPVLRGTLLLENTPLAGVQLQYALAVIRYMRATDPSDPRFLRDQGYIMFSLGRLVEGEAALRQYLQLCPQADDLEQVQEFLTMPATDEF